MPSWNSVEDIVDAVASSLRLGRIGAYQEGIRTQMLQSLLRRANHRHMMPHCLLEHPSDQLLPNPSFPASSFAAWWDGIRLSSSSHPNGTEIITLARHTIWRIWKVTPKPNFDASFVDQSGSGGIGVVLRNETGLFLAGRAIHLPRCLNARTVEALAMRKALNLASEMHLSRCLKHQFRKIYFNFSPWTSNHYACCGELFSLNQQDKYMDFNSSFMVN
ncbi:hypothetical protein RJ639_018922 [Escallonia herrerae]|uniref:RNase H type-1 domain-containing protein n=1 Tax=Escallonia herrerae TaxID=1293975 RepID=A0AA88VAE3_9ASTE|nr:hypothetical protein RJ639_018922 [Escallonia herrerae]